MARGKKDKANVFLTWLKKILIVAAAVVVYIISPLDILPGKPWDDVIVGGLGVAVIIVMSITDLINGTDSTYAMVDQVRTTGNHYQRKYIEKKYEERDAAYKRDRAERDAARKKERDERDAQYRSYRAENRKRFDEMKKMDANKQQRFEYYKAKEERKQAERAERDNASSFDTDDFFNASVKNSEKYLSKKYSNERARERQDDKK